LPFWLCLSLAVSQGKFVTIAFTALPFSSLKGKISAFVLWIIGRHRGGYDHVGDCAQLL